MYLARDRILSCFHGVHNAVRSTLPGCVSFQDGTDLCCPGTLKNTNQNNTSLKKKKKGRRKEIFYLTTQSTHFYLRLYGVRYMVKDHSDSVCYSFRLEQSFYFFFKYAPPHRQDNTYHGICYTSRAALAGTKNSR